MNSHINNFYKNLRVIFKITKFFLRFVAIYNIDTYNVKVDEYFLFYGVFLKK